MKQCPYVFRSLCRALLDSFNLRSMLFGWNDQSSQFSEGVGGWGCGWGEGGWVKLSWSPFRPCLRDSSDGINYIWRRSIRMILDEAKSTNKNGSNYSHLINCKSFQRQKPKKIPISTVRYRSKRRESRHHDRDFDLSQGSHQMASIVTTTRFYSNDDRRSQIEINCRSNHLGNCETKSTQS